MKGKTQLGNLESYDDDANKFSAGLTKLNDKNSSMSLIDNPEQDRNLAISHSPFEPNGWYEL